MADEEAWWRWAWSTGLRGFLEVLPANALVELRDEAFGHLRTRRRPDGIHLDQRARFVIARRP